MALKTLSYGNDLRCPSGSRCAARRLFSKYFCSLETALAVWDGRSGSWRAERLRLGGLSPCCAEKLGWGELSSCWDVVDFHHAVLRGWDGVDFHRPVLRGWDGEDVLHTVLID